MAFPTSPTNGSTATVNSIVYQYSSTDNAWTRLASPPGNLTVTSNLTSSGNLIAGNLYASTLSWANGAAVSLTGTYSNVNVEAYIGGNIGAYQTFANANAATQATAINTINANLGAYQIANNANVGTLFLGNASTQANLGAFYNYANTKIGTNTNSNLVVVATTTSISTTTGAFVVKGGIGVAGNIISGGNITGSFGTFVSNLSIGTSLIQQDALNLNNNNLYNVNTIRINDPGTSEGIAWEGGSGWNIYESPNDLSNNTGNLQIVRNGIRTLTVDTSGAVNIPNSQAAISTTTGALTVGGGVGIAGNLWVGGNIYAANLIGVNSSTISVVDPLLYLNADSPFPYNYDIGFYSHFVGGGPTSHYQHTGFSRNYTDSTWTLFSNVFAEPGVTIDWTEANIIFDPIKVGAATIANTTISTSTTTGALVVAGGAGIAGALYIANTGDVSANIGAFYTYANTTDATTQANIGAFYEYANANIGTLFLGNISTQANIGAFQIYANTAIASLYSSANANTAAYLLTSTGNISAGNVISDTYYSPGGASRFELTDIGLVSIAVAGQEYKFGASGIESSPGIFGGSYAGNKLSLNNETNLIANRYDLVKIQTGTDGSVQNEWVFSNNALSAPGSITALGNIVANSGTAATSKTTGALVVAGGAGISGSAYVDKLYTTQGLFWAGNGFVITTGGGGGGGGSNPAGDQGSLQFNDGGTFNGSTVLFDNVTGNLVVTNTTTSTSTTTGALVVQGGVGVAGNVFASKLYTSAGLYWSGNGAPFGGGGYTSDTAPPASPIIGDQWYDTATDILYEYIEDGTSSYWVDVLSPLFTSGLTTSLVGNLSITGFLNTTRTVSATGNISTLSNISVKGNANIFGNILGGNITVNNQARIGSNLTVVGYTTMSNITATGNIISSGTITTTGNIAANNISVTNNISTLNMVTGNLSVTGTVNGNLSLTGNVTADDLTSTDLVSGNITTTNRLVATGNVEFSGANVALGNVANVRIDGGSNGHYLQTYGNGVVNWQSLPLTSIQEFTATGGQTVFTIVGTYTVGTVLVFVNGIQMNSGDYTATDGTTVVLTDARLGGDIVRIISSVGASSLSSGLVLSVTNTKNFAVAMSIALGM